MVLEKEAKQNHETINRLTIDLKIKESSLQFTEK